VIADLDWLDAMASVAGACFDDETKNNGWPQAMRPNQLVSLQRPYERGDIKGKRYAQALYEAIDAACKDGRLKCERVTETTPGTPESFPRNKNYRLGWGGPDMGAPRNYVPASPPQKSEHFEVTAAAFSAWLAGQGVEPSQHIKHWFEFCGVGVAKSNTPTATGTTEEAFSNTENHPFKKTELIKRLAPHVIGGEEKLKNLLDAPTKNGFAECARGHGRYDAVKVIRRLQELGCWKQELEVAPRGSGLRDVQDAWSEVRKARKAS